MFLVITIGGILLLFGWIAGSHGNIRFRSHMLEDWFAFGLPLFGILGLISTSKSFK